jgi:hypothetical protein
MTPEARELMMNWIADHGADHDDDCPSDDTCSCSMKPKSDAINACCVFLHNAPARIRELEAAIAERDEAIRVLAEALEANQAPWVDPLVLSWDATTKVCEARNKPYQDRIYAAEAAARANPIARAAIKRGNK